MPSPICEVKDGAAAYAATTNGADVTPTNTVVIRLAAQAGVVTWQISCIYTDETTSAAAINASMVVDANLKTATFTAPAAGKAMIFQSTINGGLGPNLLPLSSYTTTLGVFTKTTGGNRVAAMNQTFEGDATYGWTGTFNAIVRNPSGGSGATPVGSGSEVQIRGSSTTFAAATNVSYVSGGLAVNASGFVSFGTGTMATVGAMRFPYAGASANKLLVVKSSSAVDTTIVSAGPGDACTFGASNFDFNFAGSNATSTFGGNYALSSLGLNLSASNNIVLTSTLNTTFTVGNNLTATAAGNFAITGAAASFVAFGASGASTGLIRLKSGAVYNVLTIDDGIGGNRSPLLQVDPSGALCTFGITAFNTTINAAALTLNSSGGTMNINATGGGINISSANGYPIALSQGPTTYVYCNGASGFNEMWKPISGSVVNLPNTPFRWGQATVNGAPTSVTATQAQYASPMITVLTGTAVAAFKLILPLVSGAEWSILNGTPYVLTVGGATGTTFTIAAGAASKALCFDGSNIVKPT